MLDVPANVAAGVLGPFVGTRPFCRADAVFFFGREREAARLANMVAAGTMTVLYGESGVGKSSLINARLPIALEELDPDWKVITFFDWQAGFESRLRETLKKKLGVVPKDGMAKDLLVYAGAADEPILLVLDQFEEFFLYHPQGHPRFEGELAKLVNRRASPVRALFSLRSDGLFLLDRLRLRIPDIFSKMMLIEPLKPEAAVDCVVRPIEAYNSVTGRPQVRVPERNSELIAALVNGAEEQEIRRRLLSGGRGKIEDSPNRSRRIVAPFLQMALAEVWEQDIIAQGGNELKISTLRSLAGLDATDGFGHLSQDSTQAVGLLAQEYVDGILKHFTSDEKIVCALIFERMVLPSGQKVAVKMVDLIPVLDANQRQVAESILNRLCDGAGGRLVRTVAPAPGDTEPMFQIVHDAMATPILGWIDELRREQRAALARADAEQAERRAAREKKKFIRAGLAACLFGLLAVCIPISIKYAAVTSHFQRLSKFAEQDTSQHFRLSLLLAVTAVLEAERHWWMNIDTSPVKEVLRRRLVRSPRDGGSFLAASFDPTTSRMTWIDAEKGKVFICFLSKVETCNQPPNQVADDPARDVSLYSLPLPSVWHSPENARLMQNSSYAIGFVKNTKEPLIYHKGFIYAQKDKRWVSYDVEKMIKNLTSFAGNILFEFAAGGLRVTVNDWPSNQMWVGFLTSEPGAELPLSGPAQWLHVKWQPGTPSPTISPDARFASTLSRAEVTRQSTPGQPVALATAQPTGRTANVMLTIVNSSERTESKKLASMSLDQFQPNILATLAAVGFTPDGAFLGAVSRETAQVFAFSLEANNYGLEKENGALSFKFDPGLGEVGPFFGSLFSPSPLAVVNASGGSAAKQNSWHFAWRTRLGVKLADTADGETLSPFRSRERLLLPGLDGANRMSFSADGRFLFLQMARFNTNSVGVRIWDLSQNWNSIIDAAKTSGQLQGLACRIAAIEGSSRQLGNQFDDLERLEWDVTGQPCPDRS